MKRLLPILLCLMSISALQAMNTTQPPKVRGLDNINNSCFANAATQVAFAMNDVTRNLLAADKSIYEENSLGTTYIDLINSMISPQEPDPTFFCLQSWNKMGIEAGQQADANDFLQQLLLSLSRDDIQPVYLPNQHSRTLSQLYTVSKISARHNDQLDHYEDPQDESAPVLLLAVNKGDTSLTNCLNNKFLRPSIEQRTINGVFSDLQRRTYLTDTQNYLIISLDRRNHTTNVITDNENQVILREANYERFQNPISFPLRNLNLNGYFDEKKNAKGAYGLIGIIMHGGNAMGGHYTAYVKSGNQWYYCSDSEVHPLNETDIGEIAAQGYGLHESIVPTTLVYELTSARAHYPPAVEQTKKTSDYYSMKDIYSDTSQEDDRLFAQALNQELNSTAQVRSIAQDRYLAHQLAQQMNESGAQSSSSNSQSDLQRALERSRKEK